MKDKKRSRFQIAMVVFLIGLVVFCALTLFAYLQVRSDLVAMLDPALIDRNLSQDTTQIVARARQLLILPEEEPIAVVITDSPKLASQSAFYENSINGDYLLLFQTSKKAVIFSPSRDILVNVGPLVFDELGEVAEATASSM